MGTKKDIDVRNDTWLPRDSNQKIQSIIHNATIQTVMDLIDLISRL